MEAKYYIDRLKEMGLSQYRIAKETGLSESTISLIVRNKRSGGMHSTVIKLQHLFTTKQMGKKISAAVD